MDSPHKRYFQSLGLFIFLADFFSKLWAGICLHTPISICSFLSFTYVENRGVTFGMISGWFPPWIMALISGLICLVLFFCVWPQASICEKYGYSAIFSGALGNMMDRLIEGAVVDFIDFHINTYHWPAFNIADIGICLGVTWILWMQWCYKRLEISKKT